MVVKESIANIADDVSGNPGLLVRHVYYAVHYDSRS